MSITPAEFIARWKNTHLTEKQGAQSHFIDLCHLVGHPTPAEVDIYGQDFTFERLVAMPEKRGKKAHGWADVYKKNFFAWEYKKPGVDLDKAYEQLKLYKDELNNPPLLVVSDLKSFRVHTNFNNAPRQVYPFNIESLDQPVIFKQLRDVFYEPENLRPQTTVEKITKQTAAKLAEIAQLAITRNERYAEQNGLPIEGIAQSVARYLDRIVFCLFAEDIGLLGDGVFSEIVRRYGHSPKNFAAQTAQLFNLMSKGGFFGVSAIPHFNGALFINEPVIELSARELEAVKEAARLDWKDVDPSIFGTLFEYGLKTEERSLLGAHYTGRDDIEALIEPVVLKPLRHEWTSIHIALEQIENEIETGSRDKVIGRHEQSVWLEKWFSRLEDIRVLDPACGSGNFLSVTLSALLDLEKQALIWAADTGVRSLDGQHFETRIRPSAMLGIEVNGYAQDLGRTVVQITYLQWLHDNGYPRPREPILRHTENIRHQDALLNMQTGLEAQWPDAEFIVGNPPFLGGSKIWKELGRSYQYKLWNTFDGRVPGGADLCCYWFDKAARHIANGHAKRAGLVATQAIRGGANRRVLETVKGVGDIFFAISDKDWVLEGANVHISLVGFDNGNQKDRILDGKAVERIFANLTAEIDLTQAKTLTSNQGVCFIGTKKAGDFNLPESEALTWLDVPNVSGKPNSDVLRPWRNGESLVQGPAPQWIIDTGTNMSRPDFELYELPFFRVDALVRPARDKNKRPLYRERWWLHAETRPGMRRSVEGKNRFLATSEVAKHRIFVWLDSEVLCDGTIYTFGRSDDYFFGVMQSCTHQLWALKMGTRLETRPRYTPSTCFDTFPFPKPTGQQIEAIEQAAIRLNEWRENWLNPPEWMKQETIEFRASENGHWHRHLVPGSTGPNGVGMAQWTRLVPINPNRPVQDFRYDPRLNEFRNHPVLMKDALSHRTLTNLYNYPPPWLQSAHRALDEAVFAAYGWPTNLEDEEILERLLALNLERSGQTTETEDQPAEVNVEAEAIKAPTIAIPIITDEMRDSWRDAVGFYFTFHLHKSQNLGRTKLQKLLYLAEATYQLPLGGEYERQAAGPLDTNMIYPLEERATSNEWLAVVPWQNDERRGINYLLGSNADDAYRLAVELLGQHTKELDELIRVFGGCNTETAEKVATLYAAWNDLLLQGKTPSEKDILDEVWNNWHERKRNIPRPIWRHSLDWMKQERFIPQGHGPATK